MAYKGTVNLTAWGSLDAGLVSSLKQAIAQALNSSPKADTQGTVSVNNTTYKFTVTRVDTALNIAYVNVPDPRR